MKPKKLQFCCAELPNGWVVLHANDSTHAYNHAALFSLKHSVLSVGVQEFALTSLAAFHVHGKQILSVNDVEDKGVFDLTLTGSVPSQAATIRDRLLAVQQSEGEDLRVDHMYDVAVEVAEAICGYRHDRWHFS